MQLYQLPIRSGYVLPNQLLGLGHSPAKTIDGVRQRENRNEKCKRSGVGVGTSEGARVRHSETPNSSNKRPKVEVVSISICVFELFISI